MKPITAAMVKELRERTDAPMMECKRALAEADGDVARAEEILRVRLGDRAARSAARLAAEGAVAAYLAPDGGCGALVEVNCETDFVAKNAEFLGFAAALAELVARTDPPDLAALSRAPLAAATVEEARRTLSGRIGENIAVRRFARLQARGRLAAYVHGGAKIGVLVDVVGGGAALAKDLALHIAAAAPLAVSAEALAPERIEREREIAAAKAAQAGKPPHVAQKMIEGAVQKFVREATLLGQPFVKNDKQSVGELLRAAGATVAGFVLFRVGEGLASRGGDSTAAGPRPAQQTG